MWARNGGSEPIISVEELAYSGRTHEMICDGSNYDGMGVQCKQSVMDFSDMPMVKSSLVVCKKNDIAFYNDSAEINPMQQSRESVR